MTSFIASTEGRELRGTTTSDSRSAVAVMIVPCGSGERGRGEKDEKDGLE